MPEESQQPLADYYARIGIAGDAAPEEVRRVYGERIREAMGDAERFAALNEAFETLKDPARRAAYDRQRRIQAQTSPPSPAPPHGAKPEEKRMNDNPTQMTPPPASPSFLNAAPVPERTVAVGGVNLPTICALDLSPCPLLSRQLLPDEGFCPECGLMIGAKLGEMPAGKPKPKLIDHDGRDFPLRPGENVVGREGADVALPDKTVSRRHARVVVEEGGAVWLEDTGSTNGTKRAGEILPAGQKASLTDGMGIQFGAVRLTVVIPAELEAAVALPAPEAGTEEDALPALEAPGGSLPQSVARLVGADGKATTLTATETTFGRRTTNRVVLTGDSFVSGSHAIIVFEGDKLILTDIGSTNGTQVNGKRIAAHVPTPLSDGDSVIMGKTAFTFRS